MLLLCWVQPCLMAQPASLLTWFEQTGGMETPRYPATMEYCKELAASSPMISFASFGLSEQGRDLPLLIVDREGLTDPEAIRRTGRIVLMIEACIHPGESEGKDAGLMLIRDLTSGTGPDKQLKPDLLNHLSILFIPIFNVDGHERFGPYNRINQNGPKEMGWRVTATNLNLNRDFLKADALEMQSWLKLFNAWLPDFFIDVHTTNGADYQYVLTYMMEVYGNMDPGLTQWASNEYLPYMTRAMEDKGYPVFPYVTFRNWHDPKSGLITRVAPPMLSQGYTSLRNRPSLLIETHMLKPYKQRVEATCECLGITLQFLDRSHKELKEKIRQADNYLLSPQFLTDSFPLQFETLRDDSVMVDFKGVKYQRIKSDLSGGYWYDYSDTAETWRIPWFSKTRPRVSVKLPMAYIIPAEWSGIIEKLRLHGVDMISLTREETLPVRSYRFSKPVWQTNPFEGHHPLTTFELEEFGEERTLPAGSVIIPVQQTTGKIIAHLLEPRGDGSLAWWGFFDAIFDQKEYAENYVMENLAPQMLEADPALKAAFDQKMKQDSVFAKNPRQILDWFYVRSPWHDNRRMVYPVCLIRDEGVLRRLGSTAP